MSKTKKLKIAILSVALLVALVMAVICMPKSVNADVSATGAVSTYFDYNEHVTNAVFENDAVEFTVAPSDHPAEISFKNELSALELGFAFDKVDDLGKIKLTLTADSAIATGNYNGKEKKYKTEIDNVLEVEFKGENKIDCVYNGVERKGIPFGKLEYSVNDGYILPSFISSGEITDEFYKVNTESVVPVEVSIEIISLKEGKTSTVFAIKNVNQKFKNGYGEDNVFNQGFKKDESGNIKSAMPIAEISSASFYNFVDGVNQVRQYFKYSGLSMKAYSVFGESTSNYFFKADDDSIVINGTSNLDITFNGLGEKEFSVYNKVNEEETEITKIKVKVNADGEETPKYLDNEKALESFKDALDKSLYKDEERKNYIDVGSGKTLTLPTFKSLVKDDITSYANLEYTVHYWTPETNSTTSSLSVPISVAGDYIFFVTFKDAAGNEMQKEDFVEVDEKDPSDVTFKGNFVFKFTILDDSELSIEGATQSDGYVGVKYKASSFDITASNYTETYRLFYSADKKDVDKDEGWIEILSLDKIADADNESIDGNYTYDQLKEIAYDGKLTFTPDKIGYYRIKCDVASTSTNRSASSATLIAVNEKPQTVTPDDHWLQNNVASVIFLSIGSACLVAIIVLLFIKPKDAETAEKPKKKK